MTIPQSFSKIHFAHANGFPAASYNKLFDALPKSIEVIAIDKFGHDERFPVVNNWHMQSQELINYVTENNGGQKVHAVGHSFGAIVSYLAVCERPDLFHSLIMLDPPLVTGLSRYFIALAKYTPLIDRLTPAKLAKSRNRKWPLNTDLVNYFSTKGLFKQMDRDCIADYVDAGMRQTEEHYELDFEPDIEAKLFRTVPDNLETYYGRLACPATMITGQDTRVCVPFMRNRFIKGNTMNHQIVPGGHMFPLENPTMVAEKIADLIAQNPVG